MITPATASAQRTASVRPLFPAFVLPLALLLAAPLLACKTAAPCPEAAPAPVAVASRPPAPPAPAQSTPPPLQPAECTTVDDCGTTQMEDGGCCPMLCQPRAVSKAALLRAAKVPCDNLVRCAQPLCRPPSFQLRLACEQGRCAMVRAGGMQE